MVYIMVLGVIYLSKTAATSELNEATRVSAIRSGTSQVRPRRAPPAEWAQQHWPVQVFFIEDGREIEEKIVAKDSVVVVFELWIS